MATLVATYNGNNFRTRSLDIDFIKYDKSITIELEIIGDEIKPLRTVVYWEIHSNGQQLDLGDLTMGQKVELLLWKAYAGGIDRPHVFHITAKGFDKKVLAAMKLNVFEKTIIKKAYWTDRYDKSISKAGINTTIKIQIEGCGLYGVPFTLEIFRKKDNENESISRKAITIDALQTEESFYLNDKLFDMGTMMNVMNRALPIDTAQLYFTLSHKDVLLYKSELLSIQRDIIELPESPEVSLKPVVVYSEEYFTQKYEPCKYEKINFVYGEQSGLVFDEKEPSTVRYPKHEVSIIAGKPKNEEERQKAKKLEIGLSNVKTQECQYSDDNKAYRTRFESQDKEDHLAIHHKDNVFDIDALEQNGIAIDEKTDSRLAFVPQYPYSEDNYLMFLTQFWIDGAQRIELPIRTCRYNKILHLDVYPDVLWTSHLKYGEAGDFFYKSEKLPLVTGFSDSLELVKFFYPIFRMTPGLEVAPLILEYLASEAETVSLGLHARYNNKKESLDYSQHYKHTTEFLIYQLVALQFALEVLLMVLSGGETAALKLPKMLQKVGGAVRKLKKLEKALEKMDMSLKFPAIATNSACYYEQQGNGKLAMVLEHSIKANPLIGITYEKEFTLGELLKNRKAKRKEKGNDKPDRLAEVAEAAGVEASLTLKVDGTIEQEYSIKINTLTGKLEVLPTIGNYLIYNQTKVTQREAISMFLKVNSSLKPKLKILDFEGELTLKGEANGAISHSQSVGKDEQGIWMQHVIEMSEITGTYMMRAKADTIFGSWDSNPEETPVPFLAFDKQTIEFPKVFLLKV